MLPQLAKCNILLCNIILPIGRGGVGRVRFCVRPHHRIKRKNCCQTALKICTGWGDLWLGIKPFLFSNPPTDRAGNLLSDRTENVARFWDDLWLGVWPLLYSTPPSERAESSLSDRLANTCVAPYFVVFVFYRSAIKHQQLINPATHTNTPPRPPTPIHTNTPTRRPTGPMTHFTNRPIAIRLTARTCTPTNPAARPLTLPPNQRNGWGRHMMCKLNFAR